MSMPRPGASLLSDPRTKAQPSAASACDFVLESLRMNVHSHFHETEYPSQGVGDYKYVIDLNFAATRSYLTHSGGDGGARLTGGSAPRG
jgi:hypothetical protein